MQRLIKFLLGYLVIFVIIPYSFYVNLHNLDYTNKQVDLVGYISLFVHFLSPIIFFIAFWLAKCKTMKERAIFVIFGFIIPFGIIYWLAYLDYLKNFHPGTIG
jgi:hypothetical protein